MTKKKTYAELIRAYKHRLLSAALKANNGNVTNAAASLGVRRPDFYKIANRCGFQMQARYRGTRPSEHEGNEAWRALGT